MAEQMDFPLPSDLPRPADDGAADHLIDVPMPQVSLRSTAGRMVDLSNLSVPRTVIYCYPMTGVPGKPLPQGWDSPVRVAALRRRTPFGITIRSFRNSRPACSALACRRPHINAKWWSVSTFHSRS